MNDQSKNLFISIPLVMGSTGYFLNGVVTSGKLIALLRDSSFGIMAVLILVGLVKMTSVFLIKIGSNK